MILELEDKLSDLINILDNDPRMLELTLLEKELLEDKELLIKIQKLHSIDKYDLVYTELKKEIFDNEKYYRYQKLENEINFLILEINQILNQLIEKRSC